MCLWYCVFGLKHLPLVLPKGWSVILEVGNATENVWLALIVSISLHRLTSILFCLLQINKLCAFEVLVPIYKLRSVRMNLSRRWEEAAAFLQSRVVWWWLVVPKYIQVDGCCMPSKALCSAYWSVGRCLRVSNGIYLLFRLKGERMYVKIFLPPPSNLSVWIGETERTVCKCDHCHYGNIPHFSKGITRSHDFKLQKQNFRQF